jgi:hypothetical protein
MKKLMFLSALVLFFATACQTDSDTVEPLVEYSISSAEADNYEVLMGVRVDDVFAEIKSYPLSSKGDYWITQSDGSLIPDADKIRAFFDIPEVATYQGAEFLTVVAIGPKASSRVSQIDRMSIGAGVESHYGDIVAACWGIYNQGFHILLIQSCIESNMCVVYDYLYNQPWFINCSSN